jgi:hypothetical protein
MRPGEIHAGGTLPLRSIDQNIGSGIGLFLFGLPFIGFPVFFALLLQSCLLHTSLAVKKSVAR